MIIVSASLIGNHHAGQEMSIELPGSFNNPKHFWRTALIMQTENMKHEELVARRTFVEPEISDGEDILKATSFFQAITGGTDVGGDIKP